MRGIAFIQIPTTLLAMVDSSVGGKTAINCSLGKNLIGAFYQPKAVFIDPKHLKTLSPKQIRNGLAEVIKYGVIYDKKFFEYLEENLEKILALNEPEITQIIKHSVEIKAEVVSEDETEKGKRMILNYGHTYGHAIEKMSDYKLLHGFAVSIGMILANEMAVEKGFLSEKEAQRVKQLIKKADLPTFTMKKPSLEDMKNDKKNSKNAITFILPTAIGSVKIFSHAY
jgi:3-dehydroquinate synthase